MGTIILYNTVRESEEPKRARGKCVYTFPSGFSMRYTHGKSKTDTGKKEE